MAELEPIEQQIRLCKDCKYMGIQSTAEYCFHQAVLYATDRVNGTTPRTCDAERAVERSDTAPCGRQGYLFEPKQAATFTDHSKQPLPTIPPAEDDKGVADWNQRAEKQNKE